MVDVVIVNLPLSLVKLGTVAHDGVERLYRQLSPFLFESEPVGGAKERKESSAAKPSIAFHCRHSPPTTRKTRSPQRGQRATNKAPNLPFACCVREGPQLRGAPRIRAPKVFLPTFPTVSSLHEMEEYLSYLGTLPYSLDNPARTILHDFNNVQKVSSRSWIQF